MTRLTFNLVLLTTVCLVSGGLHAESSPDTSGFRIQNYIPERFVDLEWRLDGEAYLSRGDATTDQGDTRFDTPHDYSGYNDNEVNQISLESAIHYRFWKHQRFVDLDLTTACGLEHGSYDNGDTQTKSPGNWSRSESLSRPESYDLNLDLSGTAGIYVIRDLFFSLEGEYSCDYRRDNRTTKTRQESGFANDIAVGERLHWSTTDDRLEQIVHELAGDIYIGWGRVNQGEYAATALDIVAELREHGLLVAEPNKSQLIGLTELVHNYKQRHAIDSRLYRIEVLQGILDYLVSEGILADPGSYEMLLLQDVWEYYPLYDRQFGFMFRAGFGGNDLFTNENRWYDRQSYDFEVRTLDSTQVTDTLTDSYTVEHSSFHHTSKSTRDHVTLLFEYYNPLSRKWQLDCTWQWWRHLLPRPVWEFSGVDDYWWWELSTDCRYIHNSRSDLLFSGAVYRQGNAAGISGETRVLSFGISTEATYRLSVPTTLRASISFTQSRYDSNTSGHTSNRISNNSEVSIGVSHYLY